MGHVVPWFSSRRGREINKQGIVDKKIMFRSWCISLRIPPLYIIHLSIFVPFYACLMTLCFVLEVLISNRHCMFNYIFFTHKFAFIHITTSRHQKWAFAHNFFSVEHVCLNFVSSSYISLSLNLTSSVYFVLGHMPYGYTKINCSDLASVVSYSHMMGYDFIVRSLSRASSQ